MSVFHFLTLVDGDKTGFVFDGEWHLESAAYPKPQTADQINHLLPMITKATQNPCKMADGTYTLDHQLRRFGGISNTTRAKTLMVQHLSVDFSTGSTIIHNAWTLDLVEPANCTDPSRLSATLVAISNKPMQT